MSTIISGGSCKSPAMLITAVPAGFQDGVERRADMSDIAALTMMRTLGSACRDAV